MQVGRIRKDEGTITFHNTIERLGGATEDLFERSRATRKTGMGKKTLVCTYNHHGEDTETNPKKSSPKEKRCSRRER